MLVNIGWGNALGATVLAVAAALTGRLCRRPALTHVLWLLVLLKLVTPPLLSVAIPWRVLQGTETADAGSSSIAVQDTVSVREPETISSAVTQQAPESSLMPVLVQAVVPAEQGPVAAESEGESL